MKIEKTHQNDQADLQTVLDATGLFPCEMLPDMLAPFLASDTEDAHWLTCHGETSPIGFCHARAEPLTEGTWNMLAIAVDPAHQGRGAGAALTRTLEQELRDRGARLVIVDTSGLPEFSQTRAFYVTNGYEAAARIPDYWAAGDDKVIFFKAL